MTHYVLPDQLSGPRGIARAACGAFVYPNEQAVRPTCPRCAALADEREEEIPKFLREDNDARRI